MKNGKVKSPMLSVKGWNILKSVFRFEPRSNYSPLTPSPALGSLKLSKLDEKGQTMIDMMITVALIGIVMAVIATLTLAGVRAWQKQFARQKLERQAQSFMYDLSYQLRQAQTNSVGISNLSGEMNNSLIWFIPVGQSNPVSFYLQSVKKSGGSVMERQAVFAQPITWISGGVTTTTYSHNVLATDFLSLLFTYPDITDPSRVVANISL